LQEPETIGTSGSCSGFLALKAVGVNTLAELNFEYDKDADVITIEGVNYSGAFFRFFANPPRDTVFKIIQDDSGSLVIQELSQELPDGLLTIEELETLKEKYSQAVYATRGVDIEHWNRLVALVEHLHHA
jgi:hypothetical protein